jgi:hypothetical protein
MYTSASTYAYNKHYKKCGQEEAGIAIPKFNEGNV